MPLAAARCPGAADKGAAVLAYPAPGPVRPAHIALAVVGPRDDVAAAACNKNRRQW